MGKEDLRRMLEDRRREAGLSSEDLNNPEPRPRRRVRKARPRIVRSSRSAKSNSPSKGVDRRRFLRIVGGVGLTGVAVYLKCRILDDKDPKAKQPKKTSPKQSPQPVNPVQQPRQANYQQFRQAIIQANQHLPPGRFSKDLRGVKRSLATNDKVIALTLDACGSRGGQGYDRELIDYLQKENIAATLFIGGRWIDANPGKLEKLASNPLFEIANHGYKHKPASVNGSRIYGIRGTRNVGELVDEVELNARKIQSLTGKKPKFYRAGTGYVDEAALRIVNSMGYEVVNWDTNSYDFTGKHSARKIRNKILGARQGSIVIMHMNHPNWNTYEGLKKAIPVLRKRGYRFAKLSDYRLRH